MIPITVGRTYLPHDSMQLRQIFSGYLIGNKYAYTFCCGVPCWHCGITNNLGAAR
jgi:hypothetical protein